MDCICTEIIIIVLYLKVYLGEPSFFLGYLLVLVHDPRRILVCRTRSQLRIPYSVRVSVEVRDFIG